MGGAAWERRQKSDIKRGDGFGFSGSGLAGCLVWIPVSSDWVALGGDVCTLMHPADQCIHPKLSTLSPSP